MCKSQRSAALALVVTMFTGCATAGNLKPIKRVNHFPKQEVLDEIEGEPTPSGVFQEVSDIRVPHWTLVDPLPQTLGPVPLTPDDDLDRAAVAAAAGAKRGVATEAMACLAHQLGEFYLAYGGSPEKSLKRFMEHRCGVSSDVTMSSWTYWDEGNIAWSEANKDGNTIDRANKAFAELTAKLNNPEVGAWFGSNAERTVAMYVVGARRVELEPMPMVPPNGRFIVAGEFLAGEADVVGGTVNVGAYDGKVCHALEAKLPKFRVQCEASTKDMEAGFEIYTRRRGDLVASSRLWQRVWPSGTLPNRFVRGKLPELWEPEPVAAADVEDDVADTPDEAAAAAITRPAPAPPLPAATFDVSPQAIQQQMLERINAMRLTAGRGEATLAQAQSDKGTSLAAHYWGALAKSDIEKMQDILFGLLAGWDVDGAIIDGTFYTSWVGGGPDDLVDDLAARPGARGVLFDAEIKTLAIAPFHDAEKGITSAMVHGWEFVEDETHLARVNNFLDHVSAGRAARDNPKPEKEVSLNTLADKLAGELSSGELELHHAAYRMVNAMAQANPGKRAMVYYAEVHDPTLVELPDDILDAVPLQVAVVVAPYKIPNAPWHTYGVIFTYLEQKSPTKVADASR